MPKKIISETRIGGLNILESYKPNPSTTGPVIGSFTVDGVVIENKVTQNGTYYESAVWEQPTTFGKGGKFFDEDGKLKPAKLLGSLDHPANGLAEMRFENSAIAWRNIYKGEDGKWIGEADILNTPAGRIVKTHLDYAKLVGGGESFGASLRGIGDSESVNTRTESYSRIIPETFELMSIDFVYDPSFSNTAVLTENKAPNKKLLIESIQRLAKEDQEHASIYENYAELLRGKKMENVQVLHESSIAAKARAQYLKALKSEAHKLYNLIYELENMDKEEFETKYKNKNYDKVLAALKKEEQALRAEIADIQVKAEQPVQQEASKKDVDKDLEEFLASIDEAEVEPVPEGAEKVKDEEVSEEVPEEASEEVSEEASEEDTNEDANEDPEDIDIEFDEDGNPIAPEEKPKEITLEEVFNVLEELKATVEALKAEVETLGKHVEDFEDEDIEIEEEDLEEDEEEDEEDLEERSELDDLTEEDLMALSDEELEYLQAQAKR